MKVRNLVMAGVFAAIICATTLFPRFPVGILGGYVHIGDAFIYLAASMLPTPFAVIASAIGSSFADLFAAPIYILPTIIIKSCMALFFTCKAKKLVCKRNIFATVFAGIVCIAGYYLAEVIIVGNFTVPLVSVVSGLFQPVASAVIYIIIASIIDKRKHIF